MTHMTPAAIAPTFNPVLTVELTATGAVLGTFKNGRVLGGPGKGGYVDLDRDEHSNGAKLLRELRTLGANDHRRQRIESQKQAGERAAAQERAQAVVSRHVTITYDDGLPCTFSTHSNLSDALGEANEHATREQSRKLHPRRAVTIVVGTSDEHPPTVVVAANGMKVTRSDSLV